MPCRAEQALLAEPPCYPLHSRGGNCTNRRLLEVPAIWRGGRPCHHTLNAPLTLGRGMPL